MRLTGTVIRGIRAPIIGSGDDLVTIAADSIIAAVNAEKFILNDKDVVGVTEAVLARSQGNYATLEQIAKDIRNKFPDGELGLLFPILSRNRFAHLLKAIALGVDKLTIQLSYPSDEVGNQLISIDQLDAKGINPYSDVLTAQEFRNIFGKVLHPFTGVDYIEYYEELCEGKADIILANSPAEILNHSKNILCADIHSRNRSKRLLKDKAKTVFGLDEILTQPVDGSGYQPDYGILGSNMATDVSVKLFPRDAQAFVETLAAELLKRTGKNIEVLVYGDGAFKDPIGGIWELADPVVCPGFTKGLNGVPNEIKLKYLADSLGIKGEAAGETIKEYIRKKDKDLSENTLSLGTTPRRLSDLLGSLCDLTGGSGDKGTPIILIQGYFDNYAS